MEHKQSMHQKVKREENLSHPEAIHVCYTDPYTDEHH